MSGMFARGFATSYFGRDVWMWGQWWMVVGEHDGKAVLENEDERTVTVPYAKVDRLIARKAQEQRA